MLVEVCVQNLEDALLAEREGADRIELCMALETGGLTPSAGLISEVVQKLRIPVHVLVRPRDGDFCYSPKEIEVLHGDVRMAVELGAHGIVTGVLDKDDTLDEEMMGRIRLATPGLHLTFHRAFDLVPDPFRTLEHLEALGIDTLLTSGQRKRALDAFSLLLELKKSSEQVTIMPGGGVRPENILRFKEAGFEAIHFSATSVQAPPKKGVDDAKFSVSDLGGSSRLVLQPHLLQEMIRSVK